MGENIVQSSFDADLRTIADSTIRSVLDIVDIVN